MWNINAVGSRDGVLKIVAAAKPTPPDADATQLEAVKTLIAGEINALPPEVNGARVDASGQAQPTGRQIQVSVLPMKLAL